MSGYSLKLIAIITMLIDHTTAILVAPSHPFYIVGRSIGRLSFPIFCFLIVEGHKHTSNIKRYLLRLLGFALISEIPFDFAFYNPLKSKEYLFHQNIFFTLFVGLLLITILDYIEDHYNKRNSLNNANTEEKIHTRFLRTDHLLSTGVIILGCLLAYFLNTDYSYIGVLMIWAFYKFNNNKEMLFVSLLLLNLIYGFPQVLAVISLFIINMYNGKKGKQANKFVFYGFYPIHLIVLCTINLLLT